MIPILEILRGVESAGHVGINRPSVDVFGACAEPSAFIEFVTDADPQIIKNLVLIQLYRADGAVNERHGNFDAAVRSARRSKTMSGELGCEVLEIVSLTQLGNYLRRSGSLSDAEAALRQGLEISNQSGNTCARAWIEYEIGYLHHLRAEFADSVKWLTSSAETAAKEEDLVGEVAAHGVLIRQYVLNGMADEAEDSIKAVVHILDGVSAAGETEWVRRWRANVQASIGEAMLALGDFPAAEEKFNEAAVITKSLRTKDIALSTISRHHGELELTRGNPEAALKLLSECVRNLRRDGLLNVRESAAETVALLGRALIATGQIEPGLTELRVALELPKHRANQRGMAWANIELAKYYLLSGDNVEARNRCEVAITLTNSHYQPVHQVATDLLRTIV